MNEIAKYHKDWVRYAEGIVGDYGEDYVQEMYLKISRIDKCKYTKDGGLNKSYIYAIVRNLCIDHKRKADRHAKHTDQIEIHEQDFKNKGLTIDEIREIHQEHLNNLSKLANNFYLKTLYLIYTDAEDPSYRQISEETGIPVTTIYNDMQLIKKILTNE